MYPLLSIDTVIWRAVLGLAIYGITYVLVLIVASPGGRLRQFFARAHYLWGWIALVLVAAVFLARIYRPQAVEANDLQQVAALTTASAASLDGNAVQTKVAMSGEPPTSEQWKAIQAVLPAGRTVTPDTDARERESRRQLLPMEHRPMSLLERNTEHLDISGTSFPLWHVAIVDYHTDACRGYGLLVKGADTWRLLHNELEICF